MPEPNEDARARLAEALWNDPETGPQMQALVKKKFPQAQIPAFEARQEGQRAVAEATRINEETRRALAEDRQQRDLAQARAGIMRDPALHIREEELPAVEKLMQDELIGNHAAAARLYRAQQQVAAPRSESYSMDIPGLDGGDEFKWLTPGIGPQNKSVLDKVTRKHAAEIINDFRAGRGQKWL